MKYLRLFLCLVAFSLTACMSHLFIDTSTRLQVENKTDVAILGLDIISEDGSSVQPWIKETIEPGEKSKVVEEDWVGKFRVRVRFDKWNGKHTVSVSACEAKVTPPIRVYEVLAKQSDANVIEKHASRCNDQSIDMTYAELELDFEGGSQYLVVEEDENGKAVFKFR